MAQVNLRFVVREVLEPSFDNQPFTVVRLVTDVRFVCLDGTLVSPEKPSWIQEPTFVSYLAMSGAKSDGK